MKKQVVYVEPADYIPKDLRKKYKLGEYAEKNIETTGNALKTAENEEAKQSLEDN
jgi:hypothetical protein